MKNFTFLIIAVVSFGLSTGLRGQNIVPNPSFETGGLPSGLTQIGNASPWGNANGGTSDYFKVGGAAFANVPSNYFGSQSANNGIAYAGFMAYGASVGLPYREYVQCQLTSTIATGVMYVVEFYVSPADGSSNWNLQALACNNIGVYFSATPVSHSGTSFIPVVPVYETTSIISNASGWTKVSFCFKTKKSGLRYMVIGNFRDNASTSTSVIGPPSQYGAAAYYYIDDVSMTPVPVPNAGPDITVDAVSCGGSGIGTIGTPSACPTCTYSWSPATYLSSPTSAQTTVTHPAGMSQPFCQTYTLTLTNASGCNTVDLVTVCFNSECFKGGDGVSRISQPESENDVIISPNPAQENFSIRISPLFEGIKTITVFDSFGNVVSEMKGVKELVDMNINLPPGLYFIRVDNGKKIITKKVIVSSS
jgi:hypothetical protein